MRTAIEPLAVLVMVAGFLLFNSAESALIGALLVAGGAYGLVLPQFVRPESPPTT